MPANTNRTHNFQAGDTVRLRGCQGIQKVTGVKDHVISTRYWDSSYRYTNRPAADFELVNPTPDPKEDIKMAKLYKTKDGDYGTMLTKDSRGWLVLELKGGKGVEAFDPQTLEEVVPYTVEISWTSGSQAHLEVPQGSLEVGDFVVDGCQLGRVMKINTKASSPKTPKNLRKVATEKVG